jgi:3-deoxy-manno-octulosonate cytidylyltransferase (CMP-KDO synthetase)
MNSQRLPGKPLADIHGKPMIQRVFEQAQLSDASRVVVATEDSIIFDCVSGFGGEVVMTSSHHQSGTDRAAEACNTLEISADVTIVNVQGDEPLIPPACINQVARDLEKPGCDMATLCQPLAESSQWLDPNVVKLTRNRLEEALYFSRAGIPFDRGRATAQDIASEISGCYRHVGIYAYSVRFLNEFVGWGPCELEETEKLEQLRALYHGARISASVAEVAIPPGIDTPHDLMQVRQIISNRDPT